MTNKTYLSELKKGDIVKLSPNGGEWKVFEVSGGNVLNKVIVLKNENGTSRTYGPQSKRWNEEVQLVRNKPATITDIVGNSLATFNKAVEDAKYAYGCGETDKGKAHELQAREAMQVLDSLHAEMYELSMKVRKTLKSREAQEIDFYANQEKIKRN